MQKVKPDYFPYYGQAMPDEKLKRKFDTAISLTFLQGILIFTVTTILK